MKKLSRSIIYALLLMLSIFSTNALMADGAEVTAKSNKQEPIKIVMSAAFVSALGINVYSDMFEYLGKKLNHDIEFVQGFSYETINKMLNAGMIDLGFVCGLPYVMEKAKPKPSYDLLLAPVMSNKKYHDKPVYYSYVIVNKNSKFNNFMDLKGSRFVFNDEISNSGYNIPRAHLIAIGETSGFFGSVIRSGSHEESIRLVASGEADASAVDSLVYDYDIANNPLYVAKTKVIKILGPTGIPPVVISKNISLSLRHKIKTILTAMNKDPIGKRILKQAMVDRFISVADSNYDDIRKMKKISDDS